MPLDVDAVTDTLRQWCFVIVWICDKDFQITIRQVSFSIRDVDSRTPIFALLLSKNKATKIMKFGWKFMVLIFHLEEKERRKRANLSFEEFLDQMQDLIWTHTDQTCSYRLNAMKMNRT